MATKKRKNISISKSKSPNTTSKKQKQIGYIIDIDPLQNLNIIDSNSNSEKKIALTDIFNNFIREFNLAGRFENFADLNKKINNGDCIKDGTNESTLRQLNLFDNFSLAELKELAHYVIDKAEENGYAVRQEFTREKKGDDSIKQRYKGFKFHIGYDAGLGLENFLEIMMYEIFTNFGKHIDPFIIKPTRVFPSRGENIKITENTFIQIGYDNCSLDATAISVDKFKYNIMLSGIRLKQDEGTSKDEDENIKTYFIGNSQKNTFIKSASKDTNTKKAMIVGKSWGDKLQTFIMWIKHLTDTSSEITVMSTCDEIVMLFSIILGLPCFYTDIGENKEKQKINRVLYFNMSQMDPVNAKKRFDNEKTIILKGYTDFIGFVRQCNEETDIYIKEIDDRPFHFKKNFYQAIIADLDVIKTNIIDDIRVTASNSVQYINGKIYELKQTKINDFLKKGNNGLIYMIRSKAKYNENSNNNSKAKLASVSGMTVEKVLSATFHFIATTYFRVDMRGVNMKGGGDSPVKLHNNMDLIFDMDPKYVYLEDGSKFDANLSLFEELYELYNKQLYELYNKQLYELYNKHMDHTYFHFISLYSESLHRLSIKPDYTSKNLSELVNNIFKEFNIFEVENAKLIKTSVSKIMKTPHASPKIPEVDPHISPTEKKGHEITIFKKPTRRSRPRYNKPRNRRSRYGDKNTRNRRSRSGDKNTRNRRSRSRDKKTRRRRSRSNSTKRSRSKDRKHMVISRSKSRSRSRSRDRISQSVDNLILV